MIGRLEGRLHRVDPGKVLIDVGGVGYLVSTTLRAFQELANRESATLWINRRGGGSRAPTTKSRRWPQDR
jgi:Holliday junction resolvasome RuvABC DNA-binding subunit